jgi:hypothetical protein
MTIPINPKNSLQASFEIPTGSGITHNVEGNLSHPEDIAVLNNLQTQVQTNTSSYQPEQNFSEVESQNQEMISEDFSVQLPAGSKTSISENIKEQNENNPTTIYQEDFVPGEDLISAENNSPASVSEIKQEEAEKTFEDYRIFPEEDCKDPESEASKWLSSQHWEDWWTDLSDDARDGIIWYTGGGYETINDYLRQGNNEWRFTAEGALNKSDLTDDDEKKDKLLKGMLSAFEQGNCPENIVTWRKFQNDDLVNRFESYGKEGVIGDIIQDPGFQSTSLTRDAYTSMFTTITTKLYVPEGTKCASGFKGAYGTEEHELLLQAGSKWRILDFSKDEDSNGLVNVYKMEAEVVE